MSFNLFAAITPLCDHITATVDNVEKVGPSSLLSLKPEEITLLLPGVFVRMASGNASSPPNVPTSFKDDHFIEITVAVRLGEKDTMPETEAGLLAGEVIESLIGFIPAAQYQAITYKGFGESAINLGYYTLPLRFETRLTFSKQINRSQP